MWNLIPVSKAPAALRPDYCPPVIHHEIGSFVIPIVGQCVDVQVKVPYAFPVGMSVYISDGTSNALFMVKSVDLAGCKISLLNFGSVYTSTEGTTLSGDVNMVLVGPLITNCCTEAIQCVGEADICFAVDASNSVGVSGWADTRAFMESLLDTLDAAQATSVLNFSLVIFSDLPKTAVYQSLIPDKASILTEFDNYPFGVFADPAPNFTNQGTEMALGIDLAKGEFDGSSRPDASKIMVVITDGVQANSTLFNTYENPKGNPIPGSWDNSDIEILSPDLAIPTAGGTPLSDSPEASAALAKAADYRVIFVPINVQGVSWSRENGLGANGGQSANDVRDHIERMASIPPESNVFEVSDFDALAQAVRSIAESIC